MTLQDILKLSLNMASLHEGERKEEIVIKSAINQAYMELSRIAKLEKEFSVELAPTDKAYHEVKLPMDFWTENKAYIKRGDGIKAFLDWTINKNKILIPAKHQGTFILHYFAQPAPLEDNGDEPELPIDAQIMLAYFGAAMGAVSSGKGDIATYYTQLYNGKKAELQDSPPLQATMQNVKGW